MSNLQNSPTICVLLIAIAVQVCSAELQQLETKSKLSIRHKSHGIIHLSTGSHLESNPFLERRWKLPILYFFDTTHDSTNRDSIRNSISYWESVTCARFEEVTNRTRVMTSLSPTNYLIFSASRIIGRQCITNIFNREHTGLAADEDDVDIYQRVAGCLTLSATRQTDVKVGSLFFFYLNEQLPPFKDDFLEVIEETKPTKTETKVSMTEDNDVIRTRSLYQLPGLSYNEVDALNSIYCKGCERDDAVNSTQCEAGCTLPTLSIYTNDGCKETSPSIDSDCNTTRTVTGREECVTSPSLSFGQSSGQPTAWCPWHLKGRDGCRVMITYTGRLRVAKPRRRDSRSREKSRRQMAVEKQEDDSKLNASRQTWGAWAKSYDWATRIGVNGSLLSLRQSASVIFRTRYVPDDQMNVSGRTTTSRGPSRRLQSDIRKAGHFYLQFTVCFRLVCDVAVGSPSDDRPAVDPGSGMASSLPLSPPPHGGTSRPLLMRRTSPTPVPRILLQGQAITTSPTIDIRLFHLEQTSPPRLNRQPLQRDRLVAMNQTREGEGGRNVQVVAIVVGCLIFLALVIAGVVGVLVSRTKHQDSVPS